MQYGQSPKVQINIKPNPVPSPLSVNVWQVLWRSPQVFPMEMAEVQLLWLYVPACTSVTETKTPIRD